MSGESPVLAFGTAGVRAPIGPGPGDMNVGTVTRVTAGVAAWMRAHAKPLRADGRFAVAVGHDARYGSQPMARAVAETFAGAGFEVTLIAEPAPTPVLAWVVRSRGLDAGVQITASHNPPGDNGYKLYLAGGAQLAAPMDREIEAEIAQQPPACQIRRSEAKSLDFGAVDAYVHAISAPIASGEQSVLRPRRTLRVLYTPMHGVGGSGLEDALRSNGFGDVHYVPSQRWPDPEFPTVAFPNPEEPGATDELLRVAGEVDADLLIALDPDADRCMLGVRVPARGAGEAGHGRVEDATAAGAGGGRREDAAAETPQVGTPLDARARYRMLTGDQTGALLAGRVVDLWRRGRRPVGSAVAPTSSPPVEPVPGARASGATDEAAKSRVVAPVVATTVVSSQLLGRIAAARGWDYVETLTGFKHLARAADGRPGSLVFAYEEAIGTAPLPQIVADKDGVATALIAAAWAAELQEQGRTLWDEWCDLQTEFGVFRTSQVSVRCDSPEQAAAIVEGFRLRPPAELAGCAVTAEPVADSAGRTTPGVRLRGTSTGVEGGLRGCEIRVIARASGTEPKAKFYVEVSASAPTEAGAVEARVDALMHRLREDVTEAATALAEF